MMRLSDLTAATKPLQQPIRLLLAAPSGSGGAAAPGASQRHAPQPQPAAGGGPLAPVVVRHDFRTSATCVVPLMLSVRNYAAQAAEVKVEVSDHSN